MILSRKLSNALNDMVNAEMWSSNLYMSMAVRCTQLGKEGCAAWMKKKSLEELEHAYEIMEYSVKNGGQVVIGVINSVPTGYGSVEEMFEHAANHEKHIRELMEKVADSAATEDDTLTRDFIKDFVHGQVEEKSARTIIEQIKECGEQSLDILDHQLGER